jgi:hypothetical protein
MKPFYRGRVRAGGPAPPRQTGPSRGIETQVNDDALRLRTQLKDVQQHLQEVIDEHDRLRSENRKLRDTAADLHSTLGRWIGPRE